MKEIMGRLKRRENIHQRVIFKSAAVAQMEYANRVLFQHDCFQD